MQQPRSAWNKRDGARDAISCDAASGVRTPDSGPVGQPVFQRRAHAWADSTCTGPKMQAANGHEGVHRKLGTHPTLDCRGASADLRASRGSDTDPTDPSQNSGGMPPRCSTYAEAQHLRASSALEPRPRERTHPPPMRRTGRHALMRGGVARDQRKGSHRRTRASADHAGRCCRRSRRTTCWAPVTPTRLWILPATRTTWRRCMPTWTPWHQFSRCVSHAPIDTATRGLPQVGVFTVSCRQHCEESYHKANDSVCRASATPQLFQTSRASICDHTAAKCCSRSSVTVLQLSCMWHTTSRDYV